MESESLANRVETLEVKIAYQERTIEELNKIVIALQDKIDRLFPQVKELAERVKPLIDQQVAAGGGEKPPHY